MLIRLPPIVPLETDEPDEDEAAAASLSEASLPPACQEPDTCGEPTDTSPKLFLRTRVRYDHAVIRRRELHPLLLSIVDEVMDAKALDRAKIPAVGLLGGSILGFAGGVPTETAVSLAAFYLLTSAFLYEPIADDCLEDSRSQERIRDLLSARILTSHKEIDQKTEQLSLYDYANKLTEKLGETICRIAGGFEQPFFRDDWQELLERFDAGIIDDNGNIVLLKMPDGIQGRILWRQPFQRTRFEIGDDFRR